MVPGILWLIDASLHLCLDLHVGFSSACLCLFLFCLLQGHLSLDWEPQDSGWPHLKISNYLCKDLLSKWGNTHRVWLSGHEHMFGGTGGTTIQPTTEGKKTRITKKLMAGRATRSRWPISWEGGGLHPGVGCRESPGMPSFAVLKSNCHPGYTSQLKVGWNDLKIVPKYSLAWKIGPDSHVT